MLDYRSVFFLLMLCFFGTSDAEAKKRKSAFERRLESKRWTLTSKSTTVRPGDIYNRSAKSIWKRRTDCFSATVDKRSVVGSEEVKQIKGEVGGFWSGISAKAKGSSFVARSYSDPYVHAIPFSELKASDACIDELIRSPDKADLVVVTDIFTAKYTTITKKSKEALLRVLMLGVKAETKNKTKSSSKDHVVIAYKRRSVAALLPLDTSRQGSLKITTTFNQGKRCNGRIRINSEEIGFTPSNAPMIHYVRANVTHHVQGFCGKYQSGKKRKSDMIQIAVRPGGVRDVTLRMQQYSLENLQTWETRYKQSKGWDTAGYVIAAGLVGTSTYFYLKRNSYYSQAEEITDISGGDRYADLRSSGKSAGDKALMFGGGGALLLSSALTHALLSTTIKKAKYNKRRKSRAGR
jgi:hypothetical protein